MNFYQYLNKNGLLHVLDGPSENIDEIRKVYRKEYKKEYRRRYQKNRIHRVIIFSPEEFALLKKASKNHKKPFSTFVRESALAYVSNGYIIPDPSETRLVLVALKKYGVNLNQISHLCNSRKTVRSTEITNVQNNFKGLEKNIKSIYTKPIKIEDFIRDVIKKNPAYAHRIQAVLNNFLS